MHSRLSFWHGWALKDGLKILIYRYLALCRSLACANLSWYLGLLLLSYFLLLDIFAVVLGQEFQFISAEDLAVAVLGRIVVALLRRLQLLTKSWWLAEFPAIDQTLGLKILKDLITIWLCSENLRHRCWVEGIKSFLDQKLTIIVRDKALIRLSCHWIEATPL